MAFICLVRSVQNMEILPPTFTVTHQTFLWPVSSKYALTFGVGNVVQCGIRSVWVTTVY